MGKRGKGGGEGDGWGGESLQYRRRCAGGPPVARARGAIQTTRWWTAHTQPPRDTRAHQISLHTHARCKIQRAGGGARGASLCAPSGAPPTRCCRFWRGGGGPRSQPQRCSTLGSSSRSLLQPVAAYCAGGNTQKAVDASRLFGFVANLVCRAQHILRGSRRRSSWKYKAHAMAACTTRAWC